MFKSAPALHKQPLILNVQLDFLHKNYTARRLNNQRISQTAEAITNTRIPKPMPIALAIAETIIHELFGS